MAPCFLEVFSFEAAGRRDQPGSLIDPLLVHSSSVLFLFRVAYLLRCILCVVALIGCFSAVTPFGVD